MSRFRLESLSAAAALLCTVVAGPALAAPISNAAFAEQVRALRADFDRTPSAVARAARLCADLPPHRAVDEPACVALQRHLRASARDRAGPSLSLAIGGLTVTFSRDA